LVSGCFTLAAPREWEVGVVFLAKGPSDVEASNSTWQQAVKHGDDFQGTVLLRAPREFRLRGVQSNDADEMWSTTLRSGGLFEDRRRYILIQQNSFVRGAAFIRRDPSAVMTMLFEWL
jgi:hypothetical protein